VRGTADGEEFSVKSNAAGDVCRCSDGKIDGFSFFLQAKEGMSSGEGRKASCWNDEKRETIL
jgi:hypothetical protein